MLVIFSLVIPNRWRFYALVAVLLVAAAPAFAAGPNEVDRSNDAVTFHEDIEPILQRSCQGCHRPEGVAYGGMIAPMALTTFEEARPWARSIARQVEAKRMPPWFASEETHGQFTNERILSGEEIDTIVRWASTGARRGDPVNAPAPIEWPSGWLIGEPDLVLDLAEPFWVDDDVRDLNISLKAEMITDEMLAEPRWIKAIEFRPGSGVVHHVVGSRMAAESETPGAAGLIGGIAPGTEPFQLPDGAGRLLVPGSQLYFAMHYNKEPGVDTGVWDRSQMAFKFHPKDAKIDRIVKWEGVGNSDFEIPPGHENWVIGASKVFEYPTTLYGYLPHSHLRGLDAKYTAYYPDGTEEVLLNIPAYDWNWQANYTYKEPKQIPAGTRVDVLMTYVNTEERNEVTALELDTTRAIRFGGPTTDEMMIGFIDYSEDRGDAQVTETQDPPATATPAAGGGQ